MITTMTPCKLMVNLSKPHHCVVYRKHLQSTLHSCPKPIWTEAGL